MLLAPDIVEAPGMETGREQTTATDGDGVRDSQACCPCCLGRGSVAACQVGGRRILLPVRYR